MRALHPERWGRLACAAAVGVLCLISPSVRAATSEAESTPAQEETASATTPTESTSAAESLLEGAPTDHKRPMNALKQLEQDLRKALKIFRTEGGGMPTPQMPVPPQPQRAHKAKQDKDWLFKDPSASDRGPSDEERYNLPQTPEDLQRKKMSPMERYFESYDKQRATGMKASGPKEEDLFGADRLSTRKREGVEDSKTDQKSEESRQKEQAMRRMLGLGEDKLGQFNSGSRSSLSDVFGMGSGAEESLTRKAMREEYREMWGLGQPASPSVRSDMPVPPAQNQFGLPGALTDRQPEQRLPSGVSSSLGAYLPSRRPSSFDSLSGVNPVLRPDSMQEVNQRALNAWNPVPARAPVAVPEPRNTRSTTPVQPQQRAF